MNRQVVAVPQHTLLGRVGQTFARCNTYVLPVIDGEGKFIGAISMAELLRWAGGGGHFYSCTGPDLLAMSSSAAHADEVRWHLMKNPPVVGPEAEISELLQLLRDFRVVLVVDQQRNPVGTILAVDVLAAMDQTESRPETVRPRPGERSIVDRGPSGIAQRELLEGQIMPT
jgi:CBS-domain-containing membrane protein